MRLAPGEIEAFSPFWLPAAIVCSGFRVSDLIPLRTDILRPRFFLRAFLGRSSVSLAAFSLAAYRGNTLSQGISNDLAEVLTPVATDSRIMS